MMMSINICANVDKSLAWLVYYGMKLNRSKCALMQDSVEYFAFGVDAEGINASRPKYKPLWRLQNQPKHRNYKDADALSRLPLPEEPYWI